MLRTMCGQLIMNESMKTTLSKAKALRPVVERLVTMSKTNNLLSRRKAGDFLQTTEPVQKLWNVMADRYADRAGGYCRITPLYNRIGDDVPVARIEFINEPVETSRARKAARNFLIKERLQWKKDFYYKQRHGIDYNTALTKE